MFDFFEKLRNKTRRERQIFALFSSLSITLFIFALWSFLSLPNTIKVISEDTKTKEDYMSPVANVKQSIQGALDSIFVEFAALKEKFSSSMSEHEFSAPINEEEVFK